MVEHLSGGVITGRGEWDPPGGQEPFSIPASNGEVSYT